MAAFQIVGFAIVSADGMLAAADGVMPPSLKFEADQTFFSAGLDRVDLIVHGRNSHEDQPNSPQRRRLVVTRQVATTAPEPAYPQATAWNPEGASFEEACAAAGLGAGRVAIIGGTAVFDMFLDRYDTFWLSQAPQIRLPGGVPVFHEAPGKSPQAILAAHGLRLAATTVLDAANGVSVAEWRRSA